MSELTLLKILTVVLIALFAWGLVELARIERYGRWVKRFDATIDWNPLSEKYGPPLSADEAAAINVGRWEGD